MNEKYRHRTAPFVKPNDFFERIQEEQEVKSELGQE